MKKIIYIFISAMLINVACSLSSNAAWMVRDPERWMKELTIVGQVDEAENQVQQKNVAQSMLILMSIGLFGDQGQIDMYEKQSDRAIENLETVKYVGWAMEGKAPTGMLEGVLDAFPTEEEILATISGADRRVTLQLNKQARTKFVDKVLNELFIRKEGYTQEDYENIRKLRQEKARNAAAVALAVAENVRHRATKRTIELSEQEERADPMFNLRQRVIRGAELESEATLYTIDSFILASLNFSVTIYKEIQLYPVVFIGDWL